MFAAWMSHFVPCKDRTACTEDGIICKACGRTHEEIARTREIVFCVLAFVSEMQYDNPDEFLDYLSRKVLRKIAKQDRTH